MDVALLRTFLAVSDTGSLSAASGRLFVTQSAVSLRLRRLEDLLGRPLFERSKAGAKLTPAGQAFERYALSLTRLWEEARQQVAVPDGFARAVAIGAQYSLWPRLGFRWIDALRAADPGLAIRAELGMPDRLTRFLTEGQVQAALTYAPTLRPGLSVRPVLEDELVMVSAAPFEGPDDPALRAAYAFCDWGPEFAEAHHAALPDLSTGIAFSLGTLAADWIATRGAAAYMPARAVRADLDAGRLHLVPDAPPFPYPAWVVTRDDLDPEVAETLSTTLAQVAAAAAAAQEAVLDRLEAVSDGPVAAMEA
ncbi:LysR family transcriptional regulator [Jannaschia sp. Os4]|uniref:LysR family transcriptional regulator n=1 Tax=Jannaschia sp. Os4 TaxID=2807617 RepID=UPI00193A058B|nr:LysR family transcriptional regulator [Jannaschia sp. Os4]MBM2574774.1 LysR family transcriptional regulator [Jannaschia sp. Os4]